MAIRNVRTDEDVPDSFRVIPVGKDAFMKKLQANGDSRRNFVARAECLLKFAFAFS